MSNAGINRQQKPAIQSVLLSSHHSSISSFDRCFLTGFREDRVPADLDAVVIGSGIGGLTAAALLSKAGKKVVVLEQHDQAGGCTHTFQNKGFEFDVGELVKETHTCGFSVIILLLLS